MKTAVISVIILVCVVIFSIFCSLYICNICEKVEDFAEDLPESVENFSDEKLSELKSEAEKMLDMWNSNSAFLHTTVPSQNVVSVKVALTKLLGSIVTKDGGAYVEAKSELEVYPKLIKNAETVTFYNIF